MVNLPINFQKDSEAGIASYNYTDIASGLGYVIYHLYGEQNTSTTSYLISKDTIGAAPRDIFKVDAADATTYTFNSSAFNLTQTMKGRVEFTFSHAIFVTTSNSVTKTNKITIELFHYDGSTETSLGSVVSPTLSNTITVKANRIMSIEVAKTLFKKGDLIRIKITTAWTQSGAGSTYTHLLGIDPLNRDSEDHGGDGGFTAATNPTYFKVAIPFIIDL